MQSPAPLSCSASTTPLKMSGHGWMNGNPVEHGVHMLLVKDACGPGSQVMRGAAVLNIADRIYGGDVGTPCALSLIGGGQAHAWQTRLPVPTKFIYKTAFCYYTAL